MNLSSKLLLRTAIIVLGLLLALSVFVAINSQSAKALDSTQWDHVRGYVYSYFNGATSSAGGDEYGLIYQKAALMHNLGGDTGTGATDTVLASYVGEGDDMANKPILIDNLMNGQTTDVPGTEFRCQWNTAGSCYAQTSIDAIKAQVDAHAAAGFSTDIIDYCATSHTASPATAGWGVIAQTGALSSSGSVPKVSEMWFSRCGWNNSCTNPPAGANAIAAPETSAGGFSQTFPTSPSCSGTDAEVVRCTADWAISLTGGNTGNGTSTLTLMTGAGQSIDVRPGSIQTMSTTGTNLQLPLDQLFSTTSLAKIDPTKTLIVASKTQHGGQAAMGLRMLGYPEVHDTAPAATGGYINGGIYRYSSAAYGSGVPYTATGDILPFLTVTSLTAGPGVRIDTSGAACTGACTGPTITGTASVSGITTTDATISGWSTNKVSTVHVEYGTTTSYGSTANNTVLHASHSGSNGVTLSGLTAGTHYYYRVTDYDSNANVSTTSLTGEFDTAAPPDSTPPTISSIVPSGYVTGTTSANVSVYYSDAGSGVNTGSVSVTLDGTALSGCTVNSDFASCTVDGIAEGSHTIGASVTDNAGNTATGSGSFFIDTYFPRVSSIMPRYTNVSSGNITATLRDTLVVDPAANSGNNLASLNVTLDGSDITSSCTATPTDANNATISCPFSGLSEGSHNAVINYTDNAGNPATGTRTIKADYTAPTVTDLAPSGTISTDSATIVAYYSDSNSGIKSTTAVVTLDGTTLTGCTATATKVTCAVTGLAAGPHSFTASVQDNATNTGTGSGSFTVVLCTPVKPDLRMTVTGAYWASFADYSAGNLSVKATVNNAGTEDAFNATITGATANNGVTLASGTGNLGNIVAGASANTVLVYSVPTGVTHFNTNIDGSAQDDCGTTFLYGV